jgi:hypothetical protein
MAGAREVVATPAVPCLSAARHRARQTRDLANESGKILAWLAAVHVFREAPRSG